MELHRKALVADMHSDTVLRMTKDFDLSKRSPSPGWVGGHIDIPRLQEGDVNLQVFACFLETNTQPEKCRIKADKMIDSLELQVSRNSDKIAICKTASEAESIIGNGKIAALTAIENGVAIANSLDNLQHFYDRGVRCMTLTHMLSNNWCISSTDRKPAFHGLTDFGREVVKKMNEIGMIVDISHASVLAVEEVLKVTKDPIIASHSCVHNICPHDRNLTDSQIKAIAENGGVIGINFFNGYLSSRWNEAAKPFFEANQDKIDSIKRLYRDDYIKEHLAMEPIFNEMNQKLAEIDVDVSTVVDHIDYIVNLVGPEYVGLGSDFDGVFSLPQGLSDCSMLPNITKELVNRGYSEENVKKILGGNFMRVFRKVCDRR